MKNFPRIERLPPYVFNITGELKMAARRRGEDIIDMSMGNPDGPTPEHIVEKTMDELMPDWHQSLLGLIEKKYAGQLSRTPAERVKQVRFLSSRGFPHEMIYSVIQDAEFD